MSQTIKTPNRTAPVIERVRLEPIKRNLIVSEKYHVSPNMLRLVVKGDELVGFNAPGADDNIKMIVPDEAGNMVMRSYTPRRYNPVAGELEIDFALHLAGPATKWALDVEVGETAIVAGPRGSKHVSGDIDRWVMVGDETAIPAMARRLEEAEAGERITAVITIPSREDMQQIESAADVDYVCVYRDELGVGATDTASLIRQLEPMDIRAGVFVWLAAEGGVVRTLRTYLTDERGLDRRWIKASGYWVEGEADTTAKFD